MNPLFSLFFTVLAVYIGIVILAYFFQSKMIFFPDRNISIDPGYLNIDFENVQFTADDGTRLHGWFIPAENPQGVLLFCHGNAGNISGRLESIQIFRNLGLSVFIFDYRGYGLSEGKTTEKGIYKDTEAVWNYLINVKNYTPPEIIIFGRSLGGSPALWLAQNRKARAVIIESTFTSVMDIGAEAYPFLPVRLISRFRFDSVNYIKNLNSPLLIVHSPQDELIPFKLGKRLFDAAKEPKQFLEIAGSHNEGFLISGQKYIGGLRDFLDKYK
ncbi:alpha/beta hydrolase [candidate division KSB1 bacterium]